MSVPVLATESNHIPPPLRPRNELQPLLDEQLRQAFTGSSNGTIGSTPPRAGPYSVSFASFTVPGFIAGGSDQALLFWPKNAPADKKLPVITVRMRARLEMASPHDLE